MDDKELKVKSIRADDNTYDKFKKLATDEFGNQGQCLTALINLYETETSKVALVERKVEIESFQDYLNKLGSLFLTSLQLNSDAEGRIRDEFARQLTSKDKTIEDLQVKINKLVSEKNSITEEYNNTIVKNEESLKRVDELADSNNNIRALNEGYKEKNDTLNGIVSEYKQYKTQVEEYKKLLADLQAKNIDLSNIIKDKDFTINKLNETVENQKTDNTKAIKNLNNNHIEEFEKIKDKHIVELEQLKDKSSITMDKALLELQKKQQYQLTQEQNKYNAAIEKHNTEIELNNNKVKALLEELEKARSVSKVKIKDIK